MGKIYLFPSQQKTRLNYMEKCMKCIIEMAHYCKYNGKKPFFFPFLKATADGRAHAPKSCRHTGSNLDTPKKGRQADQRPKPKAWKNSLLITSMSL